MNLSRDFLIVLDDRKIGGCRTLVGLSGLIARVGEDWANRLIDAAYSSLDDVFTRKLRRGLTVQFYSK